MTDLCLSVKRHINQFLVPKPLIKRVPYYHYKHFSALTYDFFNQDKWNLRLCSACGAPKNWEKQVVTRKFSRYTDEILANYYFIHKLSISGTECSNCSLNDEAEPMSLDNFEEDWAEYHQYGDWDNADPDLFS